MAGRGAGGGPRAAVKAVVDMNLSPLWVEALLEGGIGAVHWSDVGDPTATDQVILAWAAANERIVLTSDLDFGRLLALTYATGPSVLLLVFEISSPKSLSRQRSRLYDRAPICSSGAPSSSSTRPVGGPELCPSRDSRPLEAAAAPTLPERSKRSKRRGADDGVDGPATVSPARASHRREAPAASRAERMRKPTKVVRAAPMANESRSLTILVHSGSEAGGCSLTRRSNCRPTRFATPPAREAPSSTMAQSRS